MNGFKLSEMDSPHSKLGEVIGGVFGVGSGSIVYGQIHLVHSIPEWLKFGQGCITALIFGGFGVLGGHWTKILIRWWKNKNSLNNKP